jgi:hypothetical protein
MPKDKQPKDVISDEVADVFALQKSLEDIEQELMANEQFRKFLELQKTTQDQIATVWKNIETQMIEHDVKSVKGDWGSITIAERQNFKANLDELPSKFVKKVADLSKIANSYALEGKLPKGVERTITKYLTKRIK